MHGILRKGGDALNSAANLLGIGGRIGRGVIFAISTCSMAPAPRGWVSQKRDGEGRMKRRVEAQHPARGLRLSVRMDRHHGAGSGRVVVCRHRRMVHRESD